MRRQRIAFGQFLQQISRDAMLFAAGFAPVLAGIFIRWGVPFAERMLTGYLQADAILSPYYLLFDIMLSMITPLIFGFVGGLVILGEIDDHVAIYLSITPLGGKGYLISRLFLPVAVACLVNAVMLPLCCISQLSLLKLFILNCSAAGMGVTTVLLVVSVSHNKVEGMAIGKLTGLILLGAFVPYFVASPLQYAAGVLPSFWLGKYLQNGSRIALTLCGVMLILWILVLGKAFGRRLSKG